MHYVHRSVLFFLLLSGAVCWAQPNQTYVYTNTIDGYQNRFVLPSGQDVAGARYMFEPDSPIQFDRLKYVREVSFKDGRDNAPPVVRGWVYRGTDKSDVVWHLLFGREQGGIPGTYPIYYSSAEGTQFTRWKVLGGTTRRQGNFEDEILAILWANQVDVDRLGLNAFSQRQQLPLTAQFAWDAIGSELNNRLRREKYTVAHRLVTLPNGLYQVDLQTLGGNGNSLFSVLGVKNDLDIKAKSYSKMLAASIGEFKPEFLRGNELDYSAIRQATGLFIQNGQLANFRLTTTKNNANNSSSCLTKPWQPLVQGDKFHQFWKLQFNVQKDQKGKYRIEQKLNIGDCKAAEARFGERYIVTKFSSQTTAGFDYSVNALTTPAGGAVMTTVTRDVLTQAPNGVKIADPIEGLTLKPLFDNTFAAYKELLLK